MKIRLLDYNIFRKWRLIIITFWSYFLFLLFHYTISHTFYLHFSLNFLFILSLNFLSSFFRSISIQFVNFHSLFCTTFFLLSVSIIFLSSPCKSLYVSNSLSIFSLYYLTPFSPLSHYTLYIFNSTSSRYFLPPHFLSSFSKRTSVLSHSLSLYTLYFSH